MKKYLSLVLLVVLALTSLAACSRGPAEVDVKLTTYAIGMSTDNGRAGQFIFHVTNVATDQKHEFVIFKTDLASDQLPMKTDDKGNMIVDEEGSGVTHIDEVADLDPGATKDLTITLEPGNYVMVCNLAENNIPHYGKGMRVVFTVK